MVCQKILPLLCMRLLQNIILISIILLLGFGCSRFNPFADRELLARVGEERLYESDVVSLFTADMTPQDSVQLLESYVDMWVKKQLKIQEAERIFSHSSDDIEKMVEEYRNSLLSHKLDQHYVDLRIDTLYSDSSIVRYYNEHKSDFILDRPLIKGRVVVLPEKDGKRRKMRELITGTGDKLLDFRDMSYKNNFELTEFNNWTEFEDFLSLLPVSRHVDNDYLLSEEGVIEMNDGEYLYLAYITEKLEIGDSNPLERVKDVISRVLFNQRKQDIIRSYEDSLYKAALEAHKVEIKSN